jgi:hypothetical protein
VTDRIDDSDQDLGESDNEEPIDFPPAERKVITQPVDLSVQTLVEQWETHLLVLPDIQREYVWDNGKASRLIESLILNIPIPVLYFAETRDAKYEIIDGHQRVRSIARYVMNEFGLSGLNVLREYKGLRFHLLPEREQRFLKMRTLRAVIVSFDSHPAMKFEIFERLNTGAIALNAQELRNSIYRGLLNKTLRDMVRLTNFRSLIGTKTPRKRMVDEELVLRFLAMRTNLEHYRPPLKRFLNEFMSQHLNPSVDELREFVVLFDETVVRIANTLGGSAFRVTDTDGQPIENAVNRALFDVQMVAFSWIQGEMPANVGDEVRRAFGTLLQDETFRDSIRRATGDRSRILLRLRQTVAALINAGIQVNVPFDLAK